MKLFNGKELKITLGTFEEAHDLLQAVANEIKEVKLPSTMIEDINPNMVKDFILTFIASKKITECLWPCLNRCLCDNERITKDFFDDVDNREMYLEIFEIVLRENITPLLKGPLLKWGPIIEKMKGLFQE